MLRYAVDLRGLLEGSILEESQIDKMCGSDHSRPVQEWSLIAIVQWWELVSLDSLGGFS